MWFTGSRSNRSRHDRSVDTDQGAVLSDPVSSPRPTTSGSTASLVWDGRDVSDGGAFTGRPAKKPFPVQYRASGSEPSRSASVETLLADREQNEDPNEPGTGTPDTPLSSSYGLALTFNSGARWFINTGFPMGPFRTLQAATVIEEREIARFNYYQAICRYIAEVGSPEYRSRTGCSDHLMVVLLTEQAMMDEAMCFERTLFDVAATSAVVIATPSSLTSVITSLLTPA